MEEDRFAQCLIYSLIQRVNPNENLFWCRRVLESVLRMRVPPRFEGLAGGGGGKLWQRGFAAQVP